MEPKIKNPLTEGGEKMTEQVQIACIQAAKEITMKIAGGLVIIGVVNDERNLQKVKQVYSEVYAAIANAAKESE